MQRNIFLFGTVFTVGVLFICLFTAFTFIHSFGIGDGKAAALYSLGGFLTLAFVLAFLTSRHTAVKGRNAFYIFTMTLGGYGMYLFLASIPLAVILSVYSFFAIPLPVVVPTFFFLIAICAGIVGNIQSWQITTTHYTVAIDNLPEWWHNKKAVLLSDTHFGLVRREKFAEQIIDKISALAPDMVFHAGDFYDGPTIRTQQLTDVWKKLAEKMPVFYAPGNHEKYGDYDAFITSIKNADITVLEDKKVIYEGMHIGGITYRSKHQVESAQAAIKGLELSPEYPSILINHPPTFHGAAHAAGVSLMLSGHTHNGQFWPDNAIARSIYGRYTFGMQQYKEMVAITSRGVGTAGPPMRLFNPPELVVITFKNQK